MMGSVFAQKSTEEVVGIYKEKSNDPVGGATIIFSPDNTYFIFHFGGVQKGTWRLKNQTLTMKRSNEPKFALYGRNLNNIDFGARLSFSTEARNGVAVRLSSSSKNNFTPVFNENANCFSPPYIYSQKEKLDEFYAAKTIGFPSNSDSGEKLNAAVYYFNITEAYNDFILINLPSQYTEAWSSKARYKDGMLYLKSGGEGLERRPLETLSEEDAAFIAHYSNKSLLPNELESGGEFFPYVENPTQEELKNYTRIETSEILRDSIVIEENSFFTATCEED